jgi:very-short-patch-repair endonuclease
MSAPASADPTRVALDRTKQVFRFLKAFSERNTPATRSLADQPWVLRFADLPSHPAVVVGTVELAGSVTGVPVEAETDSSNSALLVVRRPELTKAPAPPPVLAEWVAPGWQEPGETPVCLESRNSVGTDGETILERFDDDPERPREFELWQRIWTAWETNERPARLAARIFDRLYELRGRIELESERVELMLGNGRIRCVRDGAVIDHPVLVQRVELLFDPRVPEFRVIDSDRSPELFTAVLHGAEGLSGEKILELQKESEAGAYHPLAREGTTGFLRQLPLLLGRDGKWSDSVPPERPSAIPIVCHDVVLFLRARPSGLPAAFDRVLSHLEQQPLLPSSLTRLVGVEPPPAAIDDELPAPAWSEPADVLLSKPANAEQVQLARALDRHKAVLVQGPPGTGKSHTIANLIGHLVAQGKRVLVTAHTTKALRVLRGHVVEDLRPLCVAVLDNDLEGRNQLEQAVRAIVTKLAISNANGLKSDIERWTTARMSRLTEIEQLAGQLARAREGEYVPVKFGSEEVPPCAAAEEIRLAGDEHAWLPAGVQPGAPLPLSTEEVDDLYATNGLLNSEEDAELGAPLPAIESILGAAEFESEVSALTAQETPAQSALWNNEARASDAGAFGTLRASLAGMLGELGGMAPWQLAVIEAGHAGMPETEVWTNLDRKVGKVVDTHNRHRELFLEWAPEIDERDIDAELTEAVAQMREHLAAGRNLGWLTIVTRRSWKRARRVCRVNGGRARALIHFRALAGFIELHTQRRDLAQRWDHQVASRGLPRFEDLAKPPEITAHGSTAQFGRLLSWWNGAFPLVQQALQRLGFRWQVWHDHASARAVHMSPFARDRDLLSVSLLPLVEVRALVARRAEAEVQLRNLASRLAPFRGALCSALRAAVERRDVSAYADCLADLEDLLAKRNLRDRRQALLAKLNTAAPAWARAVANREAPHDKIRVPGDVKSAWRWRQLLEEIERRSALDEVAIARRLETARQDLRAATATLIDRKAWLSQLQRTDLAAQQALYGWLDTQRKIGKGTGRRVPELRAQSRKLLSIARDAVPVWIMPLSRVAESFDPARGIFDVVIVDEASQSDVTGLLAWYLGRQVAIVGDHEQVSPLAVGQTVDSANALISEHLTGIPNSHLYDGKTSIYDLARQSFGGVIGLREHFRCVPDIIDFSNYLSYDGEIRPLRNPASAKQPHVVEVVVPSMLASGRDDKTNLAEARIIAALVKAICEDSELDGKTLGAITLLGDQQAKLIQEITVSLVGAVELDQRRFAAGNAAQFQGDERDIIWLSMVDAPTGRPLRFSDSQAVKQRYNVAASRARDQLWLVHSLDPTRDLQPGDLRRRLIEHVRDPGANRRALQQALARAESPFEQEVILRLVANGFQVTPQVAVGHYRIDMVVSDGPNQVAVECDGDRFHPFEQIGEDMTRQAILERAGWRFVRLRGTRFYRDPDRVMGGLLEQLNRLGIRPIGAENSERPPVGGDDVRERMLTQAWNTLLEQGWVPNSDGTSSAAPSDA